MSCCKKDCHKKKHHKSSKKCCPEPCGGCTPQRDCCDTLASAFAELPALFSLDDGTQTILSVSVGSPVPREIDVFASVSPNALPEPGDVPSQIQFRVQVVGIDPVTGAPNGAYVTFDMNNAFPVQSESASITRRYTLPAGAFVVNLIATASNINGQSINLDPAIGGASLLVLQRPTP